MEITAPGIILAVRPFGEGDAVAAVFTEAHGIYRGLARGAQTRGKAALWQPGNLVEMRWVARLADQLGNISGDMVHPAAALAMDDPWSLAILTAICAVADGALPERQPYPPVLRGLLHVIAHLADSVALLPEVIRWELGVLRELGFGLDLSECAVTGTRAHLAYVSPRTGRAVCAEAAGLWKERLMVLPDFLTAGGAGDIAQWADGLKLTGRFLARDAFGGQNKPLPEARARLELKTWEAARAV